MTKREVIRRALTNEEIPYVPWHFRFTHEAWDKLVHGKERKLHSLSGTCSRRRCAFREYAQFHRDYNGPGGN